MSQMMAIQRERFWWFGGALGALSTGLLVGGMKNGISSVKIGFIPFSILSLVTAYTWDMAYGNKINRINSMHRDILNDSNYFFHSMNISSNDNKSDE